MACRPGLSFRALLFRRGERAGFCCLVKGPFVISSARAIDRCDTAFRWACDALFEFDRKLLLNAPLCRMLDMCAQVYTACKQAIHNAKFFAAAITAAVIDLPCCHSALHRFGAMRAEVCVHPRRRCVGLRGKLLGR